jgi:hypothetical protein
MQHSIFYDNIGIGYFDNHCSIAISVEDVCQGFTSKNCSDICNVVNNAPVCSCGNGFYLATDDQTCIGESKSRTTRQYLNVFFCMFSHYKKKTFIFSSNGRNYSKKM